MSQKYFKENFQFGIINPSQNIPLTVNNADIDLTSRVIDQVNYGYNLTNKIFDGADRRDYTLGRQIIEKTINAEYGLTTALGNTVSVGAGGVGVGGGGGALEASKINEIAAKIHNAQVGSRINEYVNTRFGNLSQENRKEIKDALIAVAYNRGDLLVTIGGMNVQSGSNRIADGKQNRIVPSSVRAQGYYNQIVSGKLKIPKLTASSASTTSNIASSKITNNTNTFTNNIREQVANLEQQLRVARNNNLSINNNNGITIG